MRYLIQLFVLLFFSQFVLAQDTLAYNNYIDYYRSGYFTPNIKSTILTRDGKFLADGDYCFTGNKKDFDLLFKTLRATSNKKYYLTKCSNISLIGTIKDSVKIGDWKIIIHNLEISENNKTVTDTIKLGTYNKTPYPQRKNFFNGTNNCKSSMGPVYIEVSCSERDSIGSNFFSEQNYVYPIQSFDGIKVYTRRNSCEYISEDEGDFIVREDTRVISIKKNDTLITSFDLRLDSKNWMHLTFTEVIKEDKLVYFSIDEKYNVNNKVLEKLKNMDIYSEIMFNLSKCWELE